MQQFLHQRKLIFSAGVPSKIYTVILFAVFTLFLNTLNAAEDCNCSAAKLISSDCKLINSNKIFEQLEQGEEKVKVIINLKQPDMLREKKVDWRSKDSMKRLHSDVKSREDKVINKMSSKEFNIRHRFENQACFSCEVTPDALEKLLADPNVESVEPVEYFYVNLAQGIPLINGSLYRSTYNGQGVAIAICDTGIDYNHPMLGDGNFPNDKVIGGYDFGDSDDDPFPTYFSSWAHGTCCAGIAAGSLGSSGNYIGGVAYNAKIYALKVADSSGSMSSDSIAKSWDWCVTHQYDDANYPILVISISLGSSSGYSSYCDNSSQAYANSANNAIAAGITIVAASGNDGFCDLISSPACLSSTIAVGAVYDAAFGTYSPCVSSSSCATKYTSTACTTGYYASDSTAADMVTSYSNVASILDVFAPSSQTCTTDIVGSTGYSTGNYYDSFGGTSAAAPYAAGTVACLQQAAKEIRGSYLTPAQVREILASTGDDVTDTKVAITKPRLNLGNAIESLEGCQAQTIGTGTTTWNYPIKTSSQDCRTQIIYLADEIGTAGTISELQIYVSTVPSTTMTNWTIRMKHTPLSEYNSYEFESSDWTTVYQADEATGSKGWRLFTFTTPFDYNGTGNLMVDFSFNNSSQSFSSGSCRYSTPGGTRTVYATANSIYGDPLDWTGSTSPSVSSSMYVPNIMLTICAPDSIDAPTLNAEPNITSGLCNNISWSEVSLADGYYAQYSTDSSFSVVDGNSGWIADANYQFCNLTNGETYWYRVKAKNNTFDVESDWSNIESSRQCATIGDFQPDCAVDMLDLAVIAEQWLWSDGTYTADIAPQPDGDGTVNFLDLAEFAQHWMK